MRGGWQAARALAVALAGPDGMVAAGTALPGRRRFFVLEQATRGAAQRLQARAAWRHRVFPRKRATQLSQPRNEIATPSSAIIMSRQDTAAKNVAPARSQEKRSAMTVQTVSATPATSSSGRFQLFTGGGSPMLTN